MNNKFTIKFNEKLFAMPWHANDYPDKETVVICRIERLEVYGFKVSILNYGGIGAFLALNELSRKKIRSIRSIVKVGDIKPLLVIKKDYKHDQVYIDLSNKQLTNAEEEVDKLEKYYRLINIFHIWLKKIYNAKHFINGTYVSDLNESIQCLIKNDDEQMLRSKNTIHNAISSDSISTTFENQYNKDKDKNNKDKDTFDADADADASADTDSDTDTENDKDYNDIDDINNITNNKPSDDMYHADFDNANYKTTVEKSFPYDTKVWQKIMACTLWKYPISDIYDKVLKIKMGSLSLGNVFPDLIELLKDKSFSNDSVPVPIQVPVINPVINPVTNPDLDPDSVSDPDSDSVSDPDSDSVSDSVSDQITNPDPDPYPVTNQVTYPDSDSDSDANLDSKNDICQYIESEEEGEVEPYIDITSKDLDILLGLIDNYINYDIIIKLNLKLTSWGYKSLQTIKDILSKIKSIPDDYQSKFSYNSIILNSPSYEFIIKSTNKALMDEIYPEGCSLEDSELGQKIINILKDYDHDIDYGIEIERNDIS